MHNVHPIFAPRVADIAFGLRYFVGMVRESIVYTAAMYVKVFAKIFERYTSAFYMPAGVARSPRGIPLERLILKLGFGKPQHKVILIALVGILFHAFAHTNGKILFLMLIEYIVFIQL